jgi:hypothetical protein
MTPHLLDLEKCVAPEGNLFVVVISLQGDTRPMGAVPPRLPVSVRRSATLAKCSALLKGDGSQCPVLLCYYCVQSAMLHVLL